VGKFIRYRAGDVREWLRSCTVQTAPTAAAEAMNNDFKNTTPAAGQAAAKQGSPWAEGTERERAVERERLTALLAEAQRYDPQHAALATRAISVFDLEEIHDAGCLDLLSRLCDWAEKLPASCRGCGHA